MKPHTRPREELERICSRHQVQILYAFGSRAVEVRHFLSGAGELSRGGLSDVDVGAKPRRGVRPDVHQKVRLAMELEDLLGVNRVDLVILPEADPFVAANVVRGERLFCEDEYLADEYDLYILRRAGDLAFLERERQALILDTGAAS